jgi:hypothetical protein
MAENFYGFEYVSLTEAESILVFGLRSRSPFELAPVAFPYVILTVA